MICDLCKTATSEIYIIRRGHQTICDRCDWSRFENYCKLSLLFEQPKVYFGVQQEKPMAEIAYPFADKQKQYGEYTDGQLSYALADARETLDRAEEMAREDFTFHGRKGPGWRKDDVLTIAQEMNRRLENAGLLGRMVVFK